MYTIAPADGQGVAKRVHRSLLKAAVQAGSSAHFPDHPLLPPPDQQQLEDGLSAVVDWLVLRREV